MTLTNHALVGAMIVSQVPNMFVSLPLAAISHFLLDALPHYGEVYENRGNLARTIWIVDVLVLCALLVLLIISAKSYSLIAGVFVAISPDLAWVYRYVCLERFGSRSEPPKGRFNTFHKSIQKLESRLGGLVIEIIVFLGLLFAASVVL